MFKGSTQLNSRASDFGKFGAMEGRRTRTRWWNRKTHEKKEKTRCNSHAFECAEEYCGSRHVKPHAACLPRGDRFCVVWSYVNAVSCSVKVKDHLSSALPLQSQLLRFGLGCFVITLSLLPLSSVYSTLHFRQWIWYTFSTFVQSPILPYGHITQGSDLHSLSKNRLRIICFLILSLGIFTKLLHSRSCVCFRIGSGCGP